MLKAATAAAALAMLAACASAEGTAGADPAAIVGRTWLAEDIGGGGLIDNSHVTLTLGPDGHASGDTGCNRFNGPYTLEGGRLSFGNAMSTRRGCAPALMQQESRYLKTLAAVTGWTLRPDGALALTGPDGAALVYRPESEGAAVMQPGQPEQRRFVCDDGSVLLIRFDRAAKTATVASGGGPIVLPQVPSGSGIRYGTPTHTLTGKGKDITWTVGRMVPRHCTGS